MADQFCLRWNNFQSNIVSALDSLKCSEDLVDVTLTCEGRNIKAHKVILSACSPYFRNVFKENPCQHPVIILKDVLAEDIVNLLSYMYQGEVFIEESKLSSFLHTAALLQVKGLTGVNQQKETFISPNASNKLYTQLTISSKFNVSGSSKETKLPALKKRRCSTSDKPNDLNTGDQNKKSKSLEHCDIGKKVNNVSLQAKENNTSKDKMLEINIEKKIVSKSEVPSIANGKDNSACEISHDFPVTVKTEQIDDNDPATPPSNNSDNDECLPNYENSMLARSLISGINPSKNDINSCSRKMSSSNTNETSTTMNWTNEPKSDTTASSPSKSPDETPIKIEMANETEYEPEILLSEHHDGAENDNTFAQDQPQGLILLGSLSTMPVLGASTSQGLSHQQSNHAAICGDCPHCGKKYSNQSALKYHVRLMHSDLTNRLCCYLCPRSFTMRETFKDHMWTSHGQRN